MAGLIATRYGSNPPQLLNRHSDAELGSSTRRISNEAFAKLYGLGDETLLHPIAVEGTQAIQEGERPRSRSLSGASTVSDSVVVS